MAKMLQYPRISRHKSLTVGSFIFEEYLEEVKRFHTYAAPGVIFGGFMVEKAKEQIPSGTLYNAVSETFSCLPDAIQLLTPCTIGNGRLKIIHLGHFALALYNKETGEGVRVGIDHKKLEPFTELKSWLLKLKPKKEQDESLLMEEIRDAGQRILMVRPVRADMERLRMQKKKEVVLCPSCDEAYPAEYGPTCLGCQGQGPYFGWPLIR
jgi:formylmethanofuran dehydrogenase subunit E